MNGRMIHVPTIAATLAEVEEAVAEATTTTAAGVHRGTTTITVVADVTTIAATAAEGATTTVVATAVVVVDVQVEEVTAVCFDAIVTGIITDGLVGATPWPPPCS